MYENGRFADEYSPDLKGFVREVALKFNIQ